MRGKLSRRMVGLAVLLVVLMAVAAGVAWATIPGSNGVINGCYAKSGGTLRVIDGSVTNCTSKETSLNWNVQGAKGDTGAVGPAGAKGDTGPAGPAGAKGDTGAAGPAGATGPVGPAGATGLPGPTGPIGPIGPAGATGSVGPAGAIGPAGPAGAKGDTGAAGPAGVAGPVGPAGPAGATGPAGSTGPAGAKGDKGDSGQTFYSLGPNQGINITLPGNIGNYAFFCQDDSYALEWVTFSGTARWWAEIDGANTTGTTPAGMAQLWANVTFGLHHYTLRVSLGTTTLAWDIFADSTAGGSCHMSIQEAITSSTIAGT